MKNSVWYYPREAFAKQVFELLTKAPTSAISLFGPRRTGKTEFLQKDMIPLAKSKKHRVIYTSMWETETPIANLLHAFDVALTGEKFSDRIASVMNDLGIKVKAGLPGTGFGFEVQKPAFQGKPQDTHLLLLGQYCERLANDDRPTFLLFDEFQELVHYEYGAPIIAALRTTLDTNKSGLVSVFTGSSQDGLRRIFSSREAPFYHFATPMTLPTLDETFVDHQLQVFESNAKRRIDRMDALSIFDEVKQNPMIFHKCLTAMMVYPHLTPDSTIEHVLKELGEQFQYDQLWDDLDSLQRAVLLLLADHTEQIYAEDSLKRIATLTSNDLPTKPQIQNAIRRFSSNGNNKNKAVAEKWGNNWRLKDPLLEVWVKRQPEYKVHKANQSIRTTSSDK